PIQRPTTTTCVTHSIADMNYTVLLVLGMAALVAAAPVFEFEGEDANHEQDGSPGEAVEGSYSWTSPEGIEFYVRYVADADGYRIVESNAVPINHDGVAADGNQGAFGSYEEEE
ncbi:unnamed protein product, partial [Meganyctiphanes norvegica]